jgi:uncharacterized protein (DUF2342 family)
MDADQCWEDAALLPMPNDLKDPAAFLSSVTVQMIYQA